MLQFTQTGATNSLTTAGCTSIHHHENFVIGYQEQELLDTVIQLYSIVDLEKLTVATITYNADSNMVCGIITGSNKPDWTTQEDIIAYIKSNKLEGKLLC